MRNPLAKVIAAGALAGLAAAAPAPAAARTFVSFGVGVPGAYGYPGYYGGYYAPPVAVGVGYGGYWGRPYWGRSYGWRRGWYGRPYRWRRW